ncbi:MAG: HD domain-containing phosphohydrolase [Thermodesulfobacteriota bacterium]
MKRNFSLLIIDDEPRMCESIMLLLSGQGNKMQSVHTAQEAVTILNEQAFDLILLDIHLSEADGFELMARTGRWQPETPIIVITGNATMDSVIKALRMGAFGYLKKPIEPEELIKNVNNALEQKMLRDENRLMAAKLRQSEQRYRRLVQNSPDMIYKLDSQGNFIFVNDAVEKLLGYRSHDLVGRPYRSIMNGQSEGLVEGFYYQNRVSQLVRADGQKRFVETSVSLIRDRHDRIIGCEGIDRDITLRKSLENALLKSFDRVQSIKYATIMGLAKLAEYRDIGTGLHLERIREYVKVIARAMSDLPQYRGYITDEYIRDLCHSSILHDIGKVGIPDSILLKPQRLSSEEFEIIKGHCRLGGDALRTIELQVEGQTLLTLGKEIAYHHHERWDGDGYPFGLKGDEIPLSARQVALADVYDALTSERSYKKAFSHEHARDIILAGRGSQFDPDVVSAFLKHENEFRDIRYRLDLQAGTISADSGLGFGSQPLF